MSTLYKRKYRIAIETFRGDVIEIPNDLRATFHVEKRINDYMWFGEILVYNLSANTETDIYKNAKTVLIEAGYEDGAYGQVFKGAVRQSLRGKENGTDYFVRLICVNDILNVGFCDLVLTAGKTGQDIMNQIARSSSVPFDIRIGPGIGTQRTQRSKVIFGPSSDALRSVALANNGFIHVDDSGVVNYSSLSTGPTGFIPQLNYKTGLIGTPQQVEQGIQFQMLINPNVVLDSWVELNNQDILQAEVPLFGLQTLLELYGRYRVIEIVITGDTRGQEWYYDINAIGAHNTLPQMLSDQHQNGV